MAFIMACIHISVCVVARTRERARCLTPSGHKHFRSTLLCSPDSRSMGSQSSSGMSGGRGSSGNPDQSDQESNQSSGTRGRRAAERQSTAEEDVDLAQVLAYLLRR